MLLDQFEDRLLRILLYTGFLSLFLSYFSTQEYKYLESISIFCAVAIATSIQAVCSFGKDRQFRVNQMASLKTNARVIRGQYGTSQEIAATELVVGDVIRLQAGDRVPADCILIEEQDMFVDERSVLKSVCESADSLIADRQLTKYSEKQCVTENNRHDNPDTFLLKDTLVMAGSGKAVVLCIGKSTLVEKEKIHVEFNTEDDLTPLQVRLETLAGLIGFFATCAASLAFVLFTVYWFLNVSVSTTDFISLEALMALLKNFQICLAILIVSVPEGMPLAISMALAFSFEKLTRDHLHISSNEALETAGSLTDICTGKTSTLTRGVLKVANLHVGGSEQSVVGPSINLELFSFLADLVSLNTEASLEMDDCTHLYVPRGSALEVALINFLIDNQVPVQDLFVTRQRSYKLLATVPFSSSRRRMIVAYQVPTQEGPVVRVVVKGAPEDIIPYCISEKNSSNEGLEFEGSRDAGN